MRGVLIKVLSKLKNILLLGCIALCSIIITSCYTPVVDNKDVKRARQSPPIPYVALTTETSHPLLERFTLEYPKSEARVVATINRLSSAQECLIESEKNADEPDLRLIDWKAITSQFEFDVCLTRIFQSLEDLEAIKSWTSFHYLKSSVNFMNLHDYPWSIRTDGIKAHSVYFYWRDSMPFHNYYGRVPRIIGGDFGVKISFDASTRKPIRVYSNQITQM